jgi:hypothetical protein
MFESKKIELENDIINVIKRHGLNSNISEDRDLKSLIERLLIANSNDP